jgi:hypothetical protein
MMINGRLSLCSEAGLLAVAFVVEVLDISFAFVRSISHMQAFGVLDERSAVDAICDVYVR